MTRAQAKAWFISRCPGGEGHEYRPDDPGVRWSKGDCYACVIDALSAPSPSTEEGSAEPTRRAHPIAAFRDPGPGHSLGRCRLSKWGLTHDHFRTDACVDWMADAAVPGAGTKGGER